jgi:hypothetical protein
MLIILNPGGLAFRPKVQAKGRLYRGACHDKSGPVGAERSYCFGNMFPMLFPRTYELNNRELVAPTIGASRRNCTSRIFHAIFRQGVFGEKVVGKVCVILYIVWRRKFGITNKSCVKNYFRVEEIL